MGVPNAGLLNDPSDGSNGSCSPIAYICQSGAGYDGPTGAGSISGAVATGAPGIGGPGTNGSYTQSVTASTAQLQGGVYPNGSDTTYWWEYGTTTAYGQQTPAVDIGSGNAAVSVSRLAHRAWSPAPPTTTGSWPRTPSAPSTAMTSR